MHDTSDAVEGSVKNQVGRQVGRRTELSFHHPAILERNNLEAPWQRRLDFHYELGLPAIHSARLLVTGDVQNLLNMLNKDWGIEKFVNFSTYTPVRFQGIDPTSGKPVYREETAGALTPGTQFSGFTSNASRWQARVGLRVTF